MNQNIFFINLFFYIKLQYVVISHNIDTNEALLTHEGVVFLLLINYNLTTYMTTN